MVATVPRPTPIAPAKTPCRRRILIACGRDFDVPNAKHVKELPSNEAKRTTRAPCFSATVA